MRLASRTVLIAWALLAAAACRKLEPPKLEAVRAIQARVRPRFAPPADGLLTDAQIDAFLRVQRAAGRRPPSDVAEGMGVDPVEFAWVRARIAEGLAALETKQVSDAALESYAAAVGRLRETRRTIRDSKAAARLDAEIAALDRERATLGGPLPATAASRNGARLASRRTELVRVGP